MSADIGPGDYVECIDVRPNSLGEPVPLVLHAIYRVAMVVEAVSCDGSTGPAVVLFDVEPEIRLFGNELFAEAFSVERFRPLYRPSADLVDRLLEAPAPERALEPA